MLRHRVPFAVVALAAVALAQPRTSKVVNSFPSPHGASYTHGLAYSKGVLWVACGLGSSTGTIYRVDAYTGAVLGTLPAPTSSMRGLTHDGITLWAASWSDNRIYQLLDTTGMIVTSFPAFTAPAHPDGLAWDGRSLLISDETDQIWWFTPAGAPLRSISVPATGGFNPRDLGWDGTSVWAGYQSNGKIRKHDPVTGAIQLEIPAPSGAFQQGLEWADWYLWSTGGFNATINQIDVGAPYLEQIGTMSFPNSIQFRLTDGQNQTGDLAVVLLSATGTSGFQAGNVTIPLTFDVVTQICLGVVTSFVAPVDAAGVAQTPLFPVPPIPAGIPFWAAAVTLNGANVTAVTDPIRFVSQ